MLYSHTWYTKVKKENLFFLSAITYIVANNIENNGQHVLHKTEPKISYVLKQNNI